MALPIKTDLEGLDISFLGQPFVSFPVKSDIDLTSMDFSFLGQPFITNPYQLSAPTSNIKTFNGLAYANTKTVNGLAVANVKSKDGLS